VSDAAAWIEGLSTTCYPKATRIVDWWHACEHIWVAAKAACGEGTAKAEAWAQARIDQLWAGEWTPFEAAFQEVQWSNPAAIQILEGEKQFFHNHRERMDYSRYRARGLPIGSGSVESACKNIVGARCTQSGMRWTNQGAQAILFLRTELLSKRWHEAWALAHQQLAPNMT
jgi:hypothetical protein